jgi:hypothetical protein
VDRTDSAYRPRRIGENWHSMTRLGAESDRMDESYGGDHAEQMNLIDIAHEGYKGPKQSYLTSC